MGARLRRAVVHGGDGGLKVRLDPEVVRNGIQSLKNEVGHHFGHFRGHAEADLEAAIGDVFTLSPGPST